jgi:D-alanine-D-alanine ligase
LSRRIAVITGGRSSEHEISVASAQSVADALAASGWEVVTVEIDRSGAWSLDSAPTAAAELDPPNRASDKLSLGRGELAHLPDPSVARALAGVEVVFPVLHGPHGEDGTVQGLLELAGVPYVGAGVAASALCMDKDLFKPAPRKHGTPFPPTPPRRLGDAPRNPFGYPAFVKPARLGSSVGISKAHDDRELAAAVALAFEHDEKVLVAEFVPGVEVEVGVLGNSRPIASLPGEISVTRNEWYDYAAKYEPGEMDLVVPARVSDEHAARAQDLAVRAFVATECEGMARVDLFVRADGEVLVNELNTIPGFTATSVYAKLFEASGIGYADLLERLIELALERHERRRHLRY